jgi:hypothetical protein
VAFFGKLIKQLDLWNVGLRRQLLTIRVSLSTEHEYRLNSDILFEVVTADALAKGFSVPARFYYLADAGFPHCPELLVLFRRVRYHLQEWGAAGC